jgi:hypothetical protein
MLVFHYEGWFQCRLATDPDPSDDPRGISGPTFAAVGEPDLDRVIRLQKPVAPRWPHDKDIGVNITRVTWQGQDQPKHPLRNGKVNLLNNPVFEGRNFLIAGTGREPIDPFYIELSGGGVTLRRQDFWNPMRPDMGIIEATPQELDRRQPTFTVNAPVVAETTGIMDFTAFRQQRMKDLQAILSKTEEPTARAALQQRIDAIQKDGLGTYGITSAIMVFLGVQEVFKFQINGSNPEVIDPQNKLGGTVGTSQYWDVEFWLGGYDVDTLVAYMKGMLAVPFFPAPKPARGTKET